MYNFICTQSEQYINIPSLQQYSYCSSSVNSNIIMESIKNDFMRSPVGKGKFLHGVGRLSSYPVVEDYKILKFSCLRSKLLKLSREKQRVELKKKLL